MNYKIMGRFVGKILMVEAVFMVPKQSHRLILKSRPIN